MKKIIPNLLLLVLFSLASVQAAAMPGLYAGEVQVADESPASRNAALQQILRKVMVRISGKRDVLANPNAAQVLKEAGSLVQKFRYRSEVLSPESGEPGPKFLHARFDPAALHRAMARHNLPVWLAQRPRVLLWVVTEDSGARQLLNIGEDSGLQGLLRQRAHDRGMPLQLPLLDLEDRAAITATDIWSGYAEAIRQASSRYPHDVVLSGRVRNLGKDRWSGDWRLWREDRYFDVTGDTGALGEVLASGIDLVQDRLAQAAATPVVAGSDLTRVLIEGVSELESYSRLMRLMGEIGEIHSLEVLEVSTEGLLLGAQIEGGREMLARGLDASPELVRLPMSGGLALSREGASATQITQTTDLAYRLVGMSTLE